MGDAADDAYNAAMRAQEHAEEVREIVASQCPRRDITQCQLDWLEDDDEEGNTHVCLTCQHRFYLE